jgi:cyclic pyranopterin phosphate synthase
MSSRPFTHLDEHGRAHMVDVTAKPETFRYALARCSVRTTDEAVLETEAAYSDLWEVARVAGIQAAKQTASLIPLCHPLCITDVALRVAPGPGRVDISASAEVLARTGVEMEALTACAVAALTVVTALHAFDPAAYIDDLTLWEKRGGRSGTWTRPPTAAPDPPGTP